MVGRRQMLPSLTSLLSSSIGLAGLTIIGVVATFGVASCCVLRFMLPTIGLSSTCWVASLSWPHHIARCC